MSELRFTCPKCGQHMQCEKAYGGDKTRCPNCQAELRVPFSHTPIEPKTQLPRAELVSVSAEPLPTFSPDPSALTQAAAPISPAITHTSEHKEASPTYICPVCQSELRIPVNQPCDGSKPQLAEKVQAREQLPAENQAQRQLTAPSEGGAGEDKIASARQARPVSLYPSIKPRLEYILSGGESVAPKYSKPNTHPGKKEPPSSESRTE